MGRLPRITRIMLLKILQNNLLCKKNTLQDGKKNVSSKNIAFLWNDMKNKEQHTILKNILWI